MNRLAIEDVIGSVEQEWLNWPGVEGVAVGVTETGEPCIVVYTSKHFAVTRIPEWVEGFPVRVERSGQFNPL
jgi:hypothetical protein